MTEPQLARAEPVRGRTSSPTTGQLARELSAELLGSALLAAIVVGSGIMASRLSPADEGLQLLQNAVATALGLAVLIVMFAPVSGSHFNPVVSAVAAATGEKSWRQAALYIPTQIAGCIAGAVLANLMFAEPAVTWSTAERASAPNVLSEVVATAGLVMVIFLLLRSGRGPLVAPAVGAYIGAAYFFTASTSFANPAISIGRMFSDSFAGIAPPSVLPFIAAQLAGGLVGGVLAVWLAPRRPAAA